MSPETWQTIGVLATIGLVLLGMGGYALDRRTERRERRQGQERIWIKEEEGIRKSERMHTENRERLDALAGFRREQEDLNDKRDEQISALFSLAATTAEANKGFNRRLELMENEARDHRRRA